MMSSPVARLRVPRRLMPSSRNRSITVLACRWLPDRVLGNSQGLSGRTAVRQVGATGQVARRSPANGSGTVTGYLPDPRLSRRSS